MRWSKTARASLIYVGLVPFLAFLLFPFFWMVITSLKSNRELYDLNQVPIFIRQGATLAHYKLLIRDTRFGTWFANSLVVGLCTTAISTAVSILAAYAIVRLRFRGSHLVGMGIFVTYLVPPTLLFLPLSRVVSLLGLSDSIWALIVTYPTFLVPFCTWLLMGYFRTIPKEMEECAMVDGATRLQALTRIILPTAIPGVLTAVLFSFTLSWSHFIYALAFVSSATQKVLTVGIATELIRGDVFYWGSLMAGALLGSVPIVVVYSCFTHRFVAGLTAGATKY
jgi:multiple sugar transport system permease protein